MRRSGSESTRRCARRANWAGGSISCGLFSTTSTAIPPLRPCPGTCRRRPGGSGIDHTRHCGGFAARDAAVCWRLLGNTGSEAEPSPDPDPETVADFLQEAGWLDQSLSVGERLRHHLAPPDERGRLNEVALALQYLLEAFPIEHIEVIGERKTFRHELEARLQAARLPVDFHQLMEEAAAGFGLRYRAVRYYKTRIGQEGFDFLEKAHNSISLSRRVGFSAATEQGVVVRLSGIFLLEEKTEVWVSGHAYIAESA